MRFLRADQLIVAVLVFLFMGYLVFAGHPLGLIGMVGIVVAATASGRARAKRESPR
jgi:hypothetical protein